MWDFAPVRDPDFTRQRFYPFWGQKPPPGSFRRIRFDGHRFVAIRTNTVGTVPWFITWKSESPPLEMVAAFLRRCPVRCLWARFHFFIPFSIDYTPALSYLKKLYDRDHRTANSFMMRSGLPWFCAVVSFLSISLTEQPSQSESSKVQNAFVTLLRNHTLLPAVMGRQWLIAQTR